MKTKILARILSLLGFSAMFTACDEISYSKPEYGVPYADYKVSGKVTDTEGNPIKGIRIAIHLPEDKPLLKDTVYSDSEGKYLLLRDQGEYPFLKGRMMVKAEDIDGMVNGGIFGTKEIFLDIASFDFEGEKGSWYDGALTKTVDIVMPETAATKK